MSWDDYGTMLQKCKNLLDLLKSLDLPFVRPRWAEFTDAGPGVGVNNSEVSFRDAELARIYCSDYRIRVHRGAGDSGQNEAERTNSAIGDSVVDGATINWEHHKRFEGLSEDEIASLSLEEYEKAEEERIERNAWKVANEIAARIDDAPVHSEYIKCFVAHKGEDGLFFNQDYLKEYMSKSGERKKDVPGAAYMKKIVSFRDTHYERGELYMEYLKRDAPKHLTISRLVFTVIPVNALVLPCLAFHVHGLMNCNCQISIIRMFLRVAILLVVFLDVLMTGNLDTTSKKTLIMGL